MLLQPPGNPLGTPVNCDWCPNTLTTQGFSQRPQRATWIQLIGCVNCGMIYEEYLCDTHFLQAATRGYRCDDCQQTDCEYACDHI